jgi:Flp pilus assembly protein TadG
MKTRRVSGERGSATTEALLLFPLVTFLIFGIIQVSIAWFARGAMQAAATDSLSAYQELSTGLSIDPPDPVATGMATMERNAKFVQNITVSGPESASRNDRVTFRVTGRVGGFFPGMTWTVSATASAPVERFRPQGNPG